MKWATSTEDGTRSPFLNNKKDSNCLETCATSSSGGQLVESVAATSTPTHDLLEKATSCSSRQQVESAAAAPAQSGLIKKANSSNDRQKVESVLATPTQNDSIGKATSSSSSRKQVEHATGTSKHNNVPTEKATNSSGGEQVESVAATSTRNDLIEKEPSTSRKQKARTQEAPIEEVTGSTGGKQVESTTAPPTPTQIVPIEKATSSRGWQPAESAAATSRHHGPIDKEVQEFVAHIKSLDMKVDVGLKTDPKHDKEMMKTKIHRYPPTIQDLGEWCTVPKMVAIGPYHRGRDSLIEAEKKKHLAAYDYTRKSGKSDKEMYDAVVSVAADARRLYDTGTMDHDFRPMMFFDACFLIQYMLWRTDGYRQMVEGEPLLESFFHSNHNVVEHDVILLDNQLPWQVVESVMSTRFKPVPLLEKFLAPWKAYLQGGHHHEQNPFVLDSGYKPPHLLGLLRSCIVGRRSNNIEQPSQAKAGSSSLSFSAMDLARIGITLTAKETTTDLIHMGLNKKGKLSAELYMVPLTFNDACASFLINMAALELRIASHFHEAAEEEDSVVCSYLLLLAMLVRREEDVEKLQTTHNLLRGVGLVHKDALNFFTSLRKSLRVPLPDRSLYARIMEEIAQYKGKRKLLMEVLDFAKENKKNIVTVFAAITVILGIIGSIVGILSALKSQNASHQ